MLNKLYRFFIKARNSTYRFFSEVGDGGVIRYKHEHGYKYKYKLDKYNPEQPKSDQPKPVQPRKSSWRIFTIVIWFIVFIEIMFIVFDCKISIDISNSLSYHVYFVSMKKSNISNIKKGNYIQFYNRNTEHYKGRKFTKKILAVEEDKLYIIQLQEPKDNIQAVITFENTILKVKDYTSLGTKIHTNTIATIPENKLFVIGTHENSFDSRYQEFGLIDKSEVIGVAVPLF
jgi:signal peptidase I